MACNHQAKDIGTYGFSGPVSREENPAAHGNVCVKEECTLCGAHRSTNINGRHVEEGCWGLSRDQRIAAAREQVARAEIPPTLERDGLRASVDAAGYVVLIGAHTNGDEIARTLPETWLAAARRRRIAVTELERELRS